MSQEVDISVQISSVEQVSSGITTITTQSIGAVPLNGFGKIDTGYLPDQASLDAEVDTKIATAVAGAGLKAGVQWTTRHTNATGNPYVVGSIVYHNGKVYRCLATNDSIEPAVGGNAYWADLGVGYLLPNENPKILGGSINTQNGASGDAVGGAGGHISQVGGNWTTGRVLTGNDEETGEPIYEERPVAGGNAGSITQNGANGSNSGDGAGAGSINTSAYEGYDGGDIITCAGDVGAGGSIDTSNGKGYIRTGVNAQIDTWGGGKIATAYGGGAIDTGLKGYIELGRLGERTTIQGTATANRKIKFPNISGTIQVGGEAVLRAVNYDLGKQTAVPADLLPLDGYEPAQYTDYIVADVSVLIKSRYTTSPSTSNVYSLGEDIWANYDPIAYPRNIKLNAIGSPYTAPVVGSYVKVDDEYLLVLNAGSLVNGVRTISVGRAQLGTSQNVAHNSGKTLGIFENTALFSASPSLAVYPNSTLGTTAISSDISIGTRPLVGSYYRSINAPSSTTSTGRQVINFVNSMNPQINLSNIGTYLQATSTSTITSTNSSIPVTGNSSFSVSNYYAKITSTNGTENVFVTGSGNGSSMTILRGVLGTTAKAHPSNATISLNVGNSAFSLLADVFVRLLPLTRL